MNLFIELYKKYKEIILYLIFGVLTTLINIIVFYLFNDLIKIDYKISNIIAWIISVVFAFVTNKTVVFESKNKNNIGKEIITFFIARIVSLIVDMIMMIIMIDIMKITSIIAKVITNVIVVIINYIFSKFIIFRKE